MEGLPGAAHLASVPARSAVSLYAADRASTVVWRVTNAATPTGPVSHVELLDAAQTMAALTMDDHADGRSMLASLHSGLMLEYIAKAHLARLNPAFIAGQSFNSLLIQGGHGPLSNGARLQTIGLPQALDRLISVLPTFPFKSVADFHPVVEARNGAAHAGVSSGGEDELLICLRATQAILAFNGWPDAGFWGASQPTVVALLDEQLDALTRQVTLAIETAKLRFDRRFNGSFSADVRAAMLEAIEGQLGEFYDDDEYAVEECPACGQDGLLHGGTEIDLEPDFDYDDGTTYVAGVGGTVVMYPAEFECRFCGLRFATRLDLEAAGLQTQIEVRDATDDEISLQSEYESTLTHEAYMNR